MPHAAPYPTTQWGERRRGRFSFLASPSRVTRREAFLGAWDDALASGARPAAGRGDLSWPWRRHTGGTFERPRLRSSRRTRTETPGHRAMWEGKTEHARESESCSVRGRRDRIRDL